MTTGEDFGTALAGLTRASRDRLTEHWAEYFGAAPPPRTSRSLMIRAVAYKMQERALGSDRVALPPHCAGDLVNGCSFRPLQQPDDPGLLRARARSGRTAGRRRTDRQLAESRPEPLHRRVPVTKDWRPQHAGLRCS